MKTGVVPVTVVVAFYSRCGTTETRALTAAVGSVNARALIRMRRMTDASGGEGLADACAGETARMRKEYVPPTESDIAGADALIVAVPPGCGVEAPEWAPLLQLLRALASQGGLRDKLAGVVAGGDEVGNAAFEATLSELGFTLVHAPAPGDSPDPGGLALVKAHGRSVAETSRRSKSTP